MPSLDFARCRLPPFQHQREDTQRLIDSPYFFITSEMRTGKTKICIDAAQFLFEAGTIDRVIVVAPAPVRDVWYDKDFGELKKHLWETTPAQIFEYHARQRGWRHGPFTTPYLWWLITNYEFLRSSARLQHLLPLCTAKTWLILDEASFLKNYAAQQTKACMQLRKACGRVTLLNGTPISHSPLDLFSQGNLLHPQILDCKYITHYRSRYAVMISVKSHRGTVLTDPRGKPIQTVDSWTNLEDLQRRFAPYTVRRLQKDCLDLPPKLDPVTLTAELTPATWKIYKAMRDNLVVWLENNTVATASQAAIKSLRLAQITSGLLGGIDEADIDTVDSSFFAQLDLGLADEISLDAADVTEHTPLIVSNTQEIGREKLDVVLWFLGQRLEQDASFHVVIWCRFRQELLRLMAAVTERYPVFTTGMIMGGQKKQDRLAAMRLLHPDSSPAGPVCVGGTYGTGSFGLNFTAAHTSINCSFDFSLGKFLQSRDRVYGPGQTEPVAYFDVIATGPKGQKTIDHTIVTARRNREDLATWTTSAWIAALKTE